MRRSAFRRGFGNSKEVSFYIPTGSTLVSVVFVESANTDITSTFSFTNINVAFVVVWIFIFTVVYLMGVAI